MRGRAQHTGSEDEHSTRDQRTDMCATHARSCGPFQQACLPACIPRMQSLHATDGGTANAFLLPPRASYLRPMSTMHAIPAPNEHYACHTCTP
eukprot:356082-Chlamydomonas_euryale.AAC.9